jgi:hypothetical protein
MLEGNLFLSLADHLRVDHILHEFSCLDFPWIVRPFFTFNNPEIFRMSGSLVVSLLTVDIESKGKLSTERGTEQWMRRKSSQPGHSAGTKSASTMDKSAKGICAKAVGRRRECSATSVKRVKKPGRKPRERSFIGVGTPNRRS